MMLIITCVRGSGENLINWCGLVHSECSKVSYYQPKNQHFFYYKSTTQNLCHIFSKINQDAHFGTKINTVTFYKGDGGGGGGGVIALRSQRYVKWRLYMFYSKYHIPDAKIYPVMMWIQIHARRVQNFFLLNRCNTAHSECSQIRYYQPKNQQF